MARNHRVFRPDERPDVEVLVAGVWLPGELRMWAQEDDSDRWHGDVAYRPQGSTTRMLASFPADFIRKDTVDRAHGRRA